MSYSHQNNDGTKKVAKKGLQAAGVASKNVIRKMGKKLASKLTKTVLKKAGKGVLLKTAPIWGSALALLIVVLFIIVALTPDISWGKSKNVTNEEDIQNKISEYVTLGSYLGFNPVWITAMDMVLYDNEDLLEHDTDENAYHFFSVYYEKYEPAKTTCVETGDNGECVKTHTTPEVILESGTYQGKSEIQGFFRSHGQPLDDIIKALENISSKPNVRLTTTALTLEFAFRDANLDKEQIEYFNDILESGLLEEEYPELAGFGWDGLGGGAYCSPNKEVNMSSWNAVFAKAGVLSSYGSDIIAIAEKQGIDPVVFAAIALHETGFGTSNAVRTKNNPGGLMKNNKLMVFSTLREGLESMGQTLHNRIITDGLTTIEKLGSKYAPVGASNDPTNLNSHWVPNISKIVSQLGGLTMNCESYSNGMNIVFDGDVSQAAQIVATAGTRYIGNSVYVFGGGRNQSDIARGRFDCSSFVHWAYAQAGINLGPLTSTSTETLNKLGRRVSFSEIKVGDILFWDTYKKDGHVGIYIGNGRWIGSQSSTGVAIVDMKSSYYTGYYSPRFSGHVRRILPDS